MAEHRVSQGDCLSSIAAAHGLVPEKIWDAPENEGLRDERAHFNALAPGDTVVVPDLTERVEEAAVDKKHRYVRKAVTEAVSLVLLDEEGKPRTELEYRVQLDGRDEPVEGTTCGEGRIEFSMPPRTRKATLLLGAPDFEEEHTLDFGGVDPVETLHGVQHRLRNLGYGVEPSGELDHATTLAIQSFQSDAELSVTGELCDETRAKLAEVYGS